MTSPTSDRRQGLIGNTPIKAPVACATSAAITLYGEQVIDAVQTSQSRVLVKNQADVTQNGIYDSSSAAWTRSLDADGNYDLAQGSMVYVTQGSQAGEVWSLRSPNPIVIGTSGLSWAQVFAGGTSPSATIVIGNGISDTSAAISAANVVGLPILFVGISVVGTPTTITAPIIDTTAQIFSLTSQVTIDNGLPVRPEWWGIANENIVHLAGLSLPAKGGTVLLSNATYKRNNHVYNGKYWSKDNVRFIGAQMPRPTTDCKSLANGTVIQGTWIMFANNCEMRDVMIDCGYTYTQTINGTVATDALIITFPSDASKAGNASVRGIRVHNVGGLCNGPADTVHACILSEGTYDTVASGDVVGIFGVHGVVIKAAAVRADTLRAYCNGSDGVIIKTDSQTTAVASDVQISKIVSRSGGPEGWTPYTVPSSAAASGTAGLRFHCYAGSMYGIQIDEYINDGYEFGLDIVITPALGYVLDTVQIGRVITRNNGSTGANLFGQNTGGALHALQIGEMINRDTPTGAICVWTTASTVKIGSLYAYNCSSSGLAASASADPVIDTFIADNCAAAYQITSSAKPRVGKTILKGTTAAYFTAAGSGQVPALSNSWTQVGGGDTFNVIPAHYGIELNGLISPGSSNVPMTLPQWAWPATEKRFMLQGRAGATQAAVPVVISTAGVVTINDSAGGTANATNYLSLAGISYSITN